VPLLYLGALLLYAPGILWGLPHATAPDRIFPWGSDELAPLGPLAQVYRVALHGGAAFDPRYPLLPYVIQAIFMAPYLLWLRITGGLSGFRVDYPYGLSDPVSALAGMTLAARLSSLVLMAALPLIAYHTARRLWDLRTARLAGLFVLLVYPFSYYARTSNVDGGGLFWTCVALLLVASCLRDGLTSRRAALLGVFAALSIATKDQGYAIFLALGLAVVGRHVNTMLRTGRGWGAALRPALMGLAAALAVYLPASGLIFNPAMFAAHVRFIIFHPGGGGGQSYFSTPATVAGYLHLASQFASLLVDSLGLPMALAALAGLGSAARRQPRALTLLLVILAILVGVILPTRFIRIRFLLPAAYVLALFAAAGVARLFERTTAAAPGTAASSGRDGARLWAGRVVVAITLVWSLVRVADLTWQMQHDSRLELEAWLRDNAQPGDHVGYYGAPLKLPALAKGIVSQPGPWAEGRDSVASWPEFIVIIPQQVYEIEHEWNLADERYRELQSGRWNYEAWLALRGPSLFDKRPINWVNPPVRLFVRRDLIPRLRDPRPRLELH
jgi:hypothetical protein